MEQPNLIYIDKLSGGDNSFKEKLISVVKFEFPKEKALCFKNIEQENFKAAAENVHKLKHKIGILGLEKSYKTAVSFEENLLEKSTKGKDEFNLIIQTITNFLNTI